MTLANEGVGLVITEPCERHTPAGEAAFSLHRPPPQLVGSHVAGTLILRLAT